MGQVVNRTSSGFQPRDDSGKYDKPEVIGVEKRHDGGEVVESKSVLNRHASKTIIDQRQPKPLQSSTPQKPKRETWSSQPGDRS